MNSFDKAESLLYMCMDSDRFAFKKEINYLKRKKAKSSISSKEIEEELKKIERKIKASISKKNWRRKNRPEFSFNNNLPITSKKDEIINAIKNNQIIIISGKTGSGKTTQIPKFCLAAERGINGIIGCTQPRRIAAMSVASRIADELGETIGKSVGYKIRFNDKTGANPFIKIMTDGILLAETQINPFLDRYDTIIIDEAHERSLNIDFLFGILKTLLKKKKNLKLIITSATIDTEKFSKVFNNAPVIEVSGRMYPVEVRYLPQKEEDRKNNIMSYAEQAVNAVHSILAESKSGDILIFMPTEQDIRETCNFLAKQNNSMLEIYPLFARLPSSQQKVIFKKILNRKIIVSTNIAETSLTIPNIKYVIDTGLARIRQYSPSTRIVSLPVKEISQSSVDQRTGRCGRVKDGICIRLFDKEDYKSRPLYISPEILRTNLAEVILKLITLRLGDISQFPFIDKPKQQNIDDGFNTLLELGAIIKNERNKYSLTEIGKIMAKMPIDPRLSRMLIESNKQKCEDEILVIVSMLSVQDPMERPVEKEKEADMKHMAFQSKSSDFITLLNIWNKYNETLGRQKSQNKMRKYCKDNFLSYRRIQESRDVHTMLTEILSEHGIYDKKKRIIPEEIKETDLLYSLIHKSILSGFLSNIAVKKNYNVYTTSKEREVLVFPGSSLYKRSKNWIVSAEIVHTSRLYSRTVANINAQWIEDIGKAQCKYSYYDPYCDKDRNEVMVFEQVSLYGLTIVKDRMVPYGTINPADATKIFIKDALVEDTFTILSLNKIKFAGDIDKLFQLQRTFPFMEHNVKLLEKCLSLESRIRKRLLLSRNDLFNFYCDHIKEVYDIKTLNAFLKKDKKYADLLRLKERDVLLSIPEEDELAVYPESVNIDDFTYYFDYYFDPLSSKDGVTIKIPVSRARAIKPESLEWIVPGLYREKVKALIKNLPKQYRKLLVPVPATVRIIIDKMPKGEKALTAALCEFIYNRFNVNIPLEIWDMEKLPDYLKMRISIIDSNDKEICVSRDPEILKNEISGESVRIVFDQAKKIWERENINQWDFNDLPEEIEFVDKNGEGWKFFPGLSDENGKVALRIFKDRENAILSHKKGIALLLSKELTGKLNMFKVEFVLPDRLKKAAMYFGGMKSIQNMLFQRIKKDYFFKDIKNKSDFYLYADSVLESFIEHGREIVFHFVNVFESYNQTNEFLRKLEIQNKKIKPILDFIKKIKYELTFLVPNDFVIIYNTKELSYLEKYIKALSIRAERGCVNLAKDEKKEEDILFFYEALDKEKENLSPYSYEEKKEAIKEFFWLLQDYKVSIFAPELKTRTRVSRKRLEKRLDEIGTML